jgi:hypothetical protein
LRTCFDSDFNDPSAFFSGENLILTERSIGNYAIATRRGLPSDVISKGAEIH